MSPGSAIGDALMNGTAIGGAHPKVLVSDASGTDAADIAGLSEDDRNARWRRSVLNRSTFYD